MPTTKQAMDLIQDSIYGDKDHFRQVAISIANNLKKRKHSYEAKQIMDWLNDVQVNNETHEGLIKYEKPSLSFDDLILPKELKDQLREVVLERQKRDVLVKYGLTYTNTILLLGKPGTGKTLTAKVLASELSLPLKEINFARLISSQMGQTGNMITYFFEEEIPGKPGVYFFDEFDALVSRRTLASQGADREYNEIVNTILKGMDNLNTSSYIIGATNLDSIIDPAIKRRFDLVLRYPSESIDRSKFITYFMQRWQVDYEPSTVVIKATDGLSPAVIEKICKQAMRIHVLHDEPINDSLFLSLTKNRKLNFRK